MHGVQEQNTESLTSGVDHLVALVAQASVGLSKIAVDGRLLVVNDELCRMLGRSRSDLLALNVAEFTHPEDLDTCLQAFRQVIADGGPVSIDKRYLLADGGIVETNSRMTRLDEHSGSTVIAVTIDMTERRRSAARIEAGEARLRLALEVCKMASWDWDMTTGAVRWSDELYSMLGFAVGAITPSFEEWAARVPADDMAQMIAIMGENNQVFPLEGLRFRLTQPDGSIRWCIAQGRCYLDSSGFPERIIGVMHDISDRHRAEETQRILVEELQHRTRNLLAIVRSISAQTLRSSESLAGFERQFNGRLSALSRVQGLLSRGADTALDLGDLIRAELAAHGADADGVRVSVAGPPLRLAPEFIQALTLALHELATNALKYGALGRDGARLSVHWRIDDAPRSRVHIGWSERGVDLTVQPVDSGGGFGRQLIERALPYEFGAETSFRFAEDGLRCTIILPVAPD